MNILWIIYSTSDSKAYEFIKSFTVLINTNIFNRRM